MADLRGKVAVVTGASRGVGKGVALGLGETGATVYVTGRTEREGEGPDFLPGTIYQTAEEVTALGGKGVAVRCDSRNEAEIVALFERVQTEQGRLDILVNNAWGGYAYMLEKGEFTWEKPFWQQPLWRWDEMINTGVRGAYIASQHAARRMVEQQSGLIVNISFWAARVYMANVVYGLSKVASDKMIHDMAHELGPYNVAAVSLYPGLVRTEGVMRAKDFFDLSNSESPQFIGRAVVALYSDPNLLQKSGSVQLAAALGLEYGFTDIDGKQPQPINMREDAG
ncbi:MAG TPA: SDR family NAD(P)-dependent oxidoreductase [Chloroflexia bacterium]|nr:SDR family NAD(P)-dependent oxidoreductase [Chloroflexia bacterium]